MRMHARAAVCLVMVVGCGEADCPDGTERGADGDCAAAGTTGPSTDAARTWIDVAAGSAHSCALDMDGFAECWGTPANSVDHGQAAMPRNEAYVRISSGDLTTCAIREDGTAECNGPQSSSLKLPDLASAEDIEHGLLGGCARFSDNRLECFGELHDAKWMPPTAALDLSPGMATACWVKTDGALECHGFDELPDYDSYDPASFVPPEGNDWTRVSTRDLLTCAVAGDGRVACWGLVGDWGESPAPIPIPDDVVATDVHTAWNGVCVSTPDTTVRCFDLDGERTPPAGASEVLTSGDGHHCAISEGDVVCWGDNTLGQASAP